MIGRRRRPLGRGLMVIGKMTRWDGMGYGDSFGGLVTLRDAPKDTARSLTQRARMCVVCCVSVGADDEPAG